MALFPDITEYGTSYYAIGQWLNAVTGGFAGIVLLVVIDMFAFFSMGFSGVETYNRLKATAVVNLVMAVALFFLGFLQGNMLTIAVVLSALIYFLN